MVQSSKSVEEYRRQILDLVGDSDFYDYNRLKHVVPPIPRMLAELKNLRKLGLEHTYDSFYTLNSNGLRSDEFISDHNGKHILFAGCSNTYGQGIPAELVWANKLYKKISETEKVSGYFNIGFIGATTIEVIMQTYLYIEKYGAPDVIFALLPDTHREITKVFKWQFLKEMMDQHGKTAQVKISEYLNADHINLVAIFMYNNFYKFCKENGIKLYSLSWAGPAKDDKLKTYTYEVDPRDHMHGLHEFEWDDLYAHAFEWKDNNKDSIYADFNLIALDDDHYGIGIHDFWYTFMYNKYLEDTKGENNG